MKSKSGRMFITLVLGLGLTLALLWLLGGGMPDVVHAQGPDGHSTYYVAPSGNCGSMTPCFSNVQSAVDAVDASSDTVKVAAGTYTGVSVRPRNDTTTTGVVTQVVYISKTVTIRGGYSTTNWTTPNPDANPTTLDAQGQGRVLYITGNVSPTVEGLRITGGDADGLGGAPSAGDVGGGVYVISATATISNNRVFSSTADSTGGGLYLAYSDATLSGNTVNGNTAFSGAGLNLRNSDGATLSGNTVTDNTADFEWSGCGGGLYLVESDAMLTGNTVNDNRARSGGGLCLVESDATLTENTVNDNYASSGGGLYLRNSAAALGENTVTANTVCGYGGGLYLLGSAATLSGNTITGNLAFGLFPTGGGSGGGLYLYDSAATLNGNIITVNTAQSQDLGGGGGGGLYLYESDATFSENAVNANIAFPGGGGLFLNHSNALLSGNTVSDNAASHSGGGLRLNSSDAILTNTVVANNHASRGSGVYIAFSSPHLLHTTIACNTDGEDSGIYLWGSYSIAALTNTILASHTVGITVTAGSTATLESTLWHSNTTDWGGAGTINRSNDYTGDPRFDADGYHLLDGSAAIDKGVDAGVTTDIDNGLRDSAPDLGADEFGSASTPAGNIYLPIVLKDYFP